MILLIGEEELIKDARRILSTEFEMKYLGMMHYFLGMEVWQSVDGIFLSQGKYEVEIMKRFKIMDCKEMATPMACNLNILIDASSEMVDAMMYCQMIVSLMYPMNTRPKICFVVKNIS